MRPNSPGVGGVPRCKQGRATTVGCGSSVTYTVQEGDSCSHIALTYGVSIADIVQANGLDASCNNLTVGPGDAKDIQDQVARAIYDWLAD